jgi:hypothetical protein
MWFATEEAQICAAFYPSNGNGKFLPEQCQPMHQQLDNLPVYYG